MNQDHNSAAPGHARFDPTRWSVVLEAAQSRAEGWPKALARLCERYWPPLYAFARHRGHGPEDAQGPRAGLLPALDRKPGAGSRRPKPRGASARSCWLPFKTLPPWSDARAGAEKRGGRAELIRIDWQDAESRIAFEPEDPLTPETAFDARWALELLGRATRRLEQEQAALGKAQAFRTLRPFLGDEGARASLSYEEAAQALNVGLPAFKTLIHRLRRRHTQLLREEVAQTVLDLNDVDAEVHALCEALVQAGGRVRV